MYDGMMMVAETIKKINSADPQKIADALKDIKFEGTTGMMSFERKEGPVWNQWMGHQLFVKKLTQFKQKGEDADVVYPNGVTKDKRQPQDGTRGFREARRR